MDILDKLKMVKDDPMWADHSEITKKTLGRAIDEIERLRTQAARHKAEIAELVGALEIGLDCAIECSNTERCASMGVYKQSRVDAAQSDVDKIRAAIAKFGPIAKEGNGSRSNEPNT